MALVCRVWAFLALILTLLHTHTTLADVVKSQEEVVVVEKDTEKPETRTCANDARQCAPTPECGIWLAQSTIPESGLGMFSGKSFDNEEDLLETGDIVIPIVDFDLNQWRYRYKCIMDDYTWDSGSTLMSDEGLVEVNALSPGFGSCANSYLDLQNVEEWRPHVDNAGLDRTRDPGAGALSSYHNRRSTAKGGIQPGQELFVSYGREWFEHRARLGPIPLTGDHRRGQLLVEKYQRMHQRFSNEMVKELWERFVWQSPYVNESRMLNALPASWEDMDYAMNKSVLEMRKKKHRVAPEWLQENGRCMDNMRVSKSTIPQAGRGAFATRFLSKGSVVAPVPLLHLPHDDRMKMYKLEKSKGRTVVKDRENSTGTQLLTNYCYGHPKSSLLLLPYGVMTAAINHNQTQANLRMQWGDPKKTGHHPEWFDLPIMSLIKQPTAGLAMELVATRDIEPDEELFLDYGDEWEAAWQEHVQQWKPPDAEHAATVDALNANKEKHVRTVYELLHDPYPEGVRLKCELCFQWKSKWRKDLGNHAALVKYVQDEDQQQQDCDLLRRDDVNGTMFYTAVLIEKHANGTDKPGNKLERVPIEAFTFVHKPYASDMHLPNAFRHPIMIPDEIFPEKWKNDAVKKEQRD